MASLLSNLYPLSNLVLFLVDLAGRVWCAFERGVRIFFIRFVVVLSLTLVFPVYGCLVLFYPTGVFRLESGGVSGVLRTLSLRGFFVGFCGRVGYQEPPFVFIRRRLYPCDCQTTNGVRSFGLSIFRVFLQGGVQGGKGRTTIFCRFACLGQVSSFGGQASFR